MISLAIASIRARTASFVAAAVAIAGAAVLLTACGVLLETALRSNVATERYAAAPLVVAADQSLHYEKDNGKAKAKPLPDHAWVRADVLTRLAGVQGADGAIGERTFSATIVGDDGTAVTGPHHGDSWGHGWGSAPLTPFTIASGRPPQAADEVVVDPRLATTAHVAVGATVSIETASSRADFHVVGLLSRSLRDQATLFFTDAEATTLAEHPDQFFAIGLPNATTMDRAAIAHALQGSAARVSSGDGRGAVEFVGSTKATATLLSLTGGVGMSSLIVALLVVSGTFTLATSLRARELALLRAVAATPAQVRRMVRSEALVVAVIAAALGCAGGYAAASWLRTRFVEIGAMPPNLAVRVGPIPALAAVALSAAGSWLAAGLAARRASRIAPTTALVESSVERRHLGVPRLVVGLLSFGAFAAVLILLTGLHTDPTSSPVAMVCVLLAAVGAALLGPAITHAATFATAPVLRLVAPRVGPLATANNRTNSTRMTTVLVPMTLAVSFACIAVLTPATITHATNRQRAAGLRADAVVVADGPGVPRSVAHAAATIAGVSAVTELLTGEVRLGQDKYAAVGVTTRDVTRNIDPDVTAGDLQSFGDQSVALADSTAAQRNARIGDDVTVTLGDGTPVHLVVAAIYRSNLGFGDAILPFDLLAAHVDRPLASAVLVRGVDPTTLDAALAPPNGIHIVTTGAYLDQTATATSTATEVRYLAMGLIITFTVIAIVNTLAMATAGRSSELAALRLAGMTPRQARRMIRLETLAVATTAVILGTAIGIAVLVSYAAGMTPNDRPYLPAAPLAVTAIAALTLAIAAAEASARATLRHDPAASLGGHS